MTIPEPRLSAFGEYRVVTPRALFDVASPYGLDSEVWGSEIVAGGTVSNVLAQSAIRVGVATGGTDAARIRTHDHFRYQSGRGQRWRVTGYCDVKAGLSGRTYRWGYYDDNDGIAFCVIDGVLYIEKRTSTGGGTPVRVAQSAWNVDKMDGSGGAANPSGKSLDWSKGHIWEGRFAWLGVGPLSLFVDGYEVHRFDHGNDALAEAAAGGGSTQRPWMKRANLPLSVEVVNATGLVAAGSFTLICANVTSEGGDELRGRSFAVVSPAGIAIDASPTERPIMALRVASIFKTVGEHGIQAFPRRLSVNAEGGRAAVRLYWNPTLVGAPSWAAAHADSAVEVAHNSAAEPDAWTVSGGVLLFRATLGGDTNGSLSDVDLSAIFDRLGRKLRRRAYGAASDTAPTGNDVLVMTGTRISTSPTMTGSIGWEESR